jgi:hypothetical protein
LQIFYIAALPKTLAGHATSQICSISWFAKTACILNHLTKKKQMRHWNIQRRRIHFQDLSNSIRSYWQFFITVSSKEPLGLYLQLWQFAERSDFWQIRGSDHFVYKPIKIRNRHALHISWTTEAKPHILNLSTSARWHFHNSSKYQPMTKYR